MRAHLAAVLFAITAGGCYASTGVGYSVGYVAPAPVYTASVNVNTYEPDLVDVGGGVRVIADYDEPVFYTDNFYWRFYGGSWYRSNVYNGGWVVYNDVPYSVRRIDRPHAYVRYRPSGYVPRSQRVQQRDHRDRRDYRDRPGPYRPGPAARDHRAPHRPAPGPAPYRPAPATRDHRAPAPAPYRSGPAPAPATRDHRAPAPATRSAPAPATRDHRAPRRDERRDNRDDDRRSRPSSRDHR